MTHDLSPDLMDLLEHSANENTQRALASDLRIFQAWSDECNYKQAIPATATQIAEFIAAMSKTKSVATITRYLSSLSKAHSRLTPNPARDEIVQAAVLGLKKKYGVGRQKKSLPLRGSELISILDRMSRYEWTSRRNRALLVVGWCCALRLSEISLLDLSSIRSTDDGLLVSISRSKTDQTGCGVDLAIPLSPLTDILSRWHADARTLYGSDSGPLFPRLGYSTRDRWFPKIGRRHRLSTRSISKIIKQILASHGIDGSVHSLRRGLITEAAAAGVPEHIIQRHSRHRSVAVLRGYVDSANIFVDNPLPTIFSGLFED